MPRLFADALIHRTSPLDSLRSRGTGKLEGVSEKKGSTGLPQARQHTLAARAGIGLLAFLALGTAHLYAQPREAAYDHRPELELERSAEFDYDPPPPGSYELPVLKPAGDGAVLSLTGRPGSLRQLLAGRITVLSFIYTRCADPRGCPYATGVLYKLHSFTERDPVLAKNLRLITFSFDPEHDTPRVLADYTRALRKKTGAEWLFLTAENNTSLNAILGAYGQQVDKRSDPSELGPYSHLLRVYLVDRGGMLRNIYSAATLDPRLVTTDVRTLLLEESRAENGIQ